MLRKIWNSILFRAFRARKVIEKFTEVFGGEFTDEMLEMLLKGMSLVFAVSNRYRKNIEGFEGRYVFEGHDGTFVTSVSFSKGKMKVHDEKIENPDILVSFRNSHALMNFLFSPKPDVLNAMLTQDVTLDGNLNYLYKFAYMANHLRLKGPELLV
ncbi:MAG: hypothetical protein HY754_01785 [Nitrospirae bacterium]|nr:hypothetical protein [Nitrospirota bacterium]